MPKTSTLSWSFPSFRTSDNCHGFLSGPFNDGVSKTGDQTSSQGLANGNRRELFHLSCELLSQIIEIKGLLQHNVAWKTIRFDSHTRSTDSSSCYTYGLWGKQGNLPTYRTHRCWGQITPIELNTLLIKPLHSAGSICLSRECFGPQCLFPIKDKMGFRIAGKGDAGSGSPRNPRR